MKRSLESSGDPSDPPEEGGSSKKTQASKIAPAVGWCFTWFGFPPNWKECLEQKQGYLRGWCGGVETCPNTGREHIQGYLEFSKKNRPTVLDLPSLHFEKARAGKERNVEYTRKDGIWAFWGTCCIPTKYREELAELYPWELEMLTLVEPAPDKRSIYWVWDEAGNVGKTTWLKHLISCRPELRCIVSGGKAADVQMQVVDYVENNQGQYPRLIVYNLPRSFKTEYLCWHALESLKDMCFFSGKFKGGMICGPCPHLFVFANEPPDYMKMSMDRWKVAKIVDKSLVWDDLKDLA
jgi:hypothetical protein